MTTAAVPAGRSGRDGGLVGGLRSAVAAAGLVAALAAAIAAVAAGGPAVLGSLAGGGLVIGFFAFGALGAGLAATHAPGLSLLVALVTYTVQVTGLLLVLVAVQRSPAATDALDVRWLAGVVLAATVAWTAALVSHALRHVPAVAAHDEGGHDH